MLCFRCNGQLFTIRRLLSCILGVVRKHLFVSEPHLISNFKERSYREEAHIGFVVRKPDFVAVKQQRRKPACASA